MDRNIQTRRQVLRRGTAAVGAMTIAGSAGCLSGGGAGDYAGWLGDPEEIEASDYYTFTKINYVGLAEYEDEFSTDTEFDSIERFWGPAAVAWDDVSMYVRYGSVQVLAAEFEQSEQVGDFEDADYTEDGEYEGYTVLVGPDEEQAVGVGDGVLVLAGFGFSRPSDPVGLVETAIDTSEGNEDTYRDANEDVGVLLDELGDGHLVTGAGLEETEQGAPEGGYFEGQVAEGRRLEVDGEDTSGKWVLVFASEDDVVVEDVETWTDESTASGGQLEDWEDVSVDSNGRVATITGTVPTDSM
jgi:hypothetical protein